jgi:hypothetical protein
MAGLEADLLPGAPNYILVQRFFFPNAVEQYNAMPRSSGPRYGNREGNTGVRSSSALNSIKTIEHVCDLNKSGKYSYIYIEFKQTD